MDTPTTNPPECDFGKELRKAREAAGMDLRQVSDLTRIQMRYLEALEAEDWSSVPRGVIGRGFVRLVCREINADADLFLEKYKLCREEEPLEHLTPTEMESEFRVGVGGRKLNLFGLRMSQEVAKLAAGGLGIILALLVLLWIWSPWSSSEERVKVPAKPAATAEHVLEIKAVKRTSLIIVKDGGEPETLKFGTSEVKKFEVNKVTLEMPEAGALRLSWDGEALMAPRVDETGSAGVSLPSDLEELKP